MKIEELIRKIIDVLPAGDYSDVEKTCIGALVRHVREVWELKVAVPAAHL